MSCEPNKQLNVMKTASNVIDIGFFLNFNTVINVQI